MISKSNQSIHTVFFSGQPGDRIAASSMFFWVTSTQSPRPFSGVLTNFWISISRYPYAPCLECLPTFTTKMTQFCRYIFHTWSIWDISSESKATRSKIVNSPLDSMQLETRRVMAWWRDGFVTEALLFTVVVTPPDPHWPGHFFWLIEPRSSQVYRSGAFFWAPVRTACQPTLEVNWQLPRHAPRATLWSHSSGVTVSRWSTWEVPWISMMRWISQIYEL